MNTTTVHIKVSDRRFMPTYAHPGDAGADLRSVEQVMLQPGHRKLIGTGVRVSIPQAYVGLVMPRSGLSANYGLSVIPGTIDSGYRGEIKVLLHNVGFEVITVGVGDRIAQLEIFPVVRAEFRVVDDLDETERGEAGIGSTGR